MNQRIRELWSKAAESTAAYPSGQNNSWETQVNFMEKFAELIVEECVAQCWTVSELESKGSVVSECSKRIRKHFGVK
jgi:hypothetical protein